jgi:DNA (cytosine-5)-methyltransferase 1
VKYSRLKKKLNWKVDNQNGESLAAFTHFLHSKDNGVPKYFSESASNYISKLEEVGILKDEGANQYNLPLEFDVPFPPTASPEFTFIDLFAGIGGFRIAFQEQEGKCVFSSEWDNFARRTYEANFGEIPFGDITKIQAQNIPDHDILCGGFPCQPFSKAGVSKKKSLGKQHGFLDKTQGTLFDDIVRIIKKKRPKAFLLENVKNLRSHDNGRTYLIIKEALRELNYKTFDRVIDASNYVPQHRERIFIVGYDKKRYGEDINFEFPTHTKKEQKLKNILNPEEDDITVELEFYDEAMEGVEGVSMPDPSE